MKTLAIIKLALCFALFAGCSKEGKDPGRSVTAMLMGGDVNVPVSPSQPQSKRIILIGGQSNTDAVYSNGSAEFNAALGHDLTNVQFMRCAQGGTDADKWIPGTPLFESCVQTILTFQAQHPGATLWGMAWVQGEAEAVSCGDWKTNFEATVNGFKSRTNSPDMAVVWERINSDFDPNAPCLAQTRTMQETANVGARAHYVDTDGIPLGPDHVHYIGNATSSGELGKRFGATLGPLLK